MCRRLFIVEETILIKGRGLVPFPGFIVQTGELFRVGDPIMLRRPGGTNLKWNIGGFELFNPPRPSGEVVILLGHLDKLEVPVGTEVWSVCRS